MKKFTINCDFEGQIAPFTIFIGTPKDGNHPLDHQAKWLADNRGGTIPAEVMDALSKLQELSKKNGVSLEELCVYALGTEEEQAELDSQSGNDAIGEPAEEGIEDMADEGGHVEDEEIEDLRGDDEKDHLAAEDMAGEGGPVEDEELQETDNKKQDDDMLIEEDDHKKSN